MHINIATCPRNSILKMKHGTASKHQTKYGLVLNISMKNWTFRLVLNALRECQLEFVSFSVQPDYDVDYSSCRMSKQQMGFFWWTMKSRLATRSLRTKFFSAANNLT